MQVFEQSAPTRLISLTNVGKVYIGGRKSGKTVNFTAINNISMDIVSNEFVAIMGKSGSGKSTLLNIIGCLEKPSSGTYTLGDVDVTKLGDNQLSEIRSFKIGFIFQSFSLISMLTVYENVEAPLIYRSMPTGKRRRIVLDALDSVGLGDKLNNFPNELSGGQKQRVAIARSLAQDPEIILADEPTGSLDSESAVEIIKIIKQLKAKGRTIIMVTHDRDIANEADRIVEIKDGRIVGSL